MLKEDLRIMINTEEGKRTKNTHKSIPKHHNTTINILEVEHVHIFLRDFGVDIFCVFFQNSKISMFFLNYGQLFFKAH